MWLGLYAVKMQETAACMVSASADYRVKSGVPCNTTRMCVHVCACACACVHLLQTPMEECRRHLTVPTTSPAPSLELVPSQLAPRYRTCKHNPPCASPGRFSFIPFKARFWASAMASGVSDSMRRQGFKGSKHATVPTASWHESTSVLYYTTMAGEPSGLERPVCLLQRPSVHQTVQGALETCESRPFKSQLPCTPQLTLAWRCWVATARPSAMPPR